MSFEQSNRRTVDRQAKERAKTTADMNRPPKNMNIIFTAEIIRKHPGCYIARANELQIGSHPATTKRGAIKKLKNAVRLYLEASIKGGGLLDALADLGFMHMDNKTLYFSPADSKEITLPLPRQNHRHRSVG